MIAESELIINPDGSIYHLDLRPEDLAENIIFVGDPDRVGLVSQYFDTIEVQKGKREFITHTGTLRGKRISVISTGIGTDNIDIVMNEIDALVNVDFGSREIKKDLKSVNIIRIGTSGSIQEDLAIGTILVSEYAIGFDALMQYYKKPYTTTEKAIKIGITEQFPELSFQPYVGCASDKLIAQFADDLPKGITMTAPGFYAPQGRSVRSVNVYPNLIELANKFRVGERRITNLEMETAGIYALANMFGHHALSVNAILASRVQEEFAKDPAVVVDLAIRHVLDRI